MRAVFLVPRRADHGHRDALWAYCKDRWERYFPDIDIVEGHHKDGSFNRAAAINSAARRAGSWDFGVVIDSDVLMSVSQAQAAIKRAQATGRVTWGHRRWRGIREDMTRRIVADQRDLGPELDRDDLDLMVERTNPLSWSCFIVLPRSVFDDIGGFDERFQGWGFEDMAFQSLIVGLYGYERIDRHANAPADIVHLWHPRSDERLILGRSRGTASVDYIRNALLGRRYMYALRRDHRGHDRAEVADEPERQRDMANIIHDDRRFLIVAKERKMPEADWGDWWPTLPELLEGAKAHHAGPPGTVTLIVHTGGLPEAWPERRDYLLRSVASLTENVTGPIVQRVIYDCWGDPAIRAWLTEEFRPYGFYVAGPDERPDYTGSMQAMWRYLQKRAKGDYIFQAEDDFIYERPVDLEQLIDALRGNGHLVQMALLRDACYQDEKETGGILGWPELAFERKDGWLEHRLFWTANPSLFRKSLTDYPWPTGQHSETLFGKKVLGDKEHRAAFWGQGEEWIRHIGQVRAGSGY